MHITYNLYDTQQALCWNEILLFIKWLHLVQSACWLPKIVCYSALNTWLSNWHQEHQFDVNM